MPLKKRKAKAKPSQNGKHTSNGKADPRLPANMNEQSRKFHELHGDWLPIDNNMRLFEDGAKLENCFGGDGYYEPPSDEWERCKLVEQFWSLKASLAADAFYEFREYLLGNGRGVEGVNTDEEKLEHLNKLRELAKAAKRKYAAARQATELAEPCWLLAKKREAANLQSRQDKLRRRVESIDL